jgi:transposase
VTPATPRSTGEREALRALIAAREGAVTARTAVLCQLRDLLVTTPEPLRSERRPLTRARLLSRLCAARPDRRQDPELRGTQLALKALARRVQQLTTEEREFGREIERLTRKLAPQLLDQPGIGPPGNRNSGAAITTESLMRRKLESDREQSLGREQ